MAESTPDPALGSSDNTYGLSLEPIFLGEATHALRRVLMYLRRVVHIGLFYTRKLFFQIVLKYAYN